MVRHTLLIVLCLFTYQSEAAYTDKNAQIKMSELDFMVGQWKGKGWIMNRERKKEFFNQTEKVEWRLDKTAILIEGKGLDPTKNIITHHALAMINWQDKSKQFRFVSVLANGRDGTFSGEINKAGQFVWQMNDSYGTRRFIIEINSNGQWFEIGEFSKDGKQWHQFFEMTLDRMAKQ